MTLSIKISPHQRSFRFEPLGFFELFDAVCVFLFVQPWPFAPGPRCMGSGPTLFEQNRLLHFLSPRETNDSFPSFLILPKDETAMRDSAFLRLLPRQVQQVVFAAMARTALGTETPAQQPMTRVTIVLPGADVGEAVVAVVAAGALTMRTDDTAPRIQQPRHPTTRGSHFVNIS